MQTGGSLFQRGLNQYGIVNQVVSPTVFLCSLTGFGDAYFNDWDCFVVRKGSGNGGAPQGDKVQVRSYTSRSGQVVLQAAFDTAPLTAGDSIMMIQAFVGENTFIVDQPSDDVKQTSNTEVSTTAAVLTRVKELAFAGKVGGARIKFDMRVDAAPGVASCVIYKNGVPITTNPSATPIYTVWTNLTGIYATITQDIGGLAAGDLIQIYAMASVGNRTFVRNFQICYDIVPLPSVLASIESVYFDSVNGVAGATGLIGTAELPCNNEADTIAIAQARNITSIKLLHGVFTLPQNMIGYKFIGNAFADPSALKQDNYIELNGYTIYNSSFEDVNIHNAAGGDLVSCGPFLRCPRVYVDDLTACVNFESCGSTPGASGIVVSGTATNCANFFNSLIKIKTATNCYFFNNCNISNSTGGSNWTSCRTFKECYNITIQNMTDCSAFYQCDLIQVPGTMDSCYFFMRCGRIIVGTIHDTNIDNAFLLEADTIDSCQLYEMAVAATNPIVGASTMRKCWSDTDMTFDMTGGTSSAIEFDTEDLFITITNMTGGSLNVFGKCWLIIDPSCTGGVINVYGGVRILSSSGGTVIRDHTGLPNDEVPVSVNAINAAETDVVNLPGGVSCHYNLEDLRLKTADPGANTISVRLYKLINSALTNVGTFTIQGSADPNPNWDWYLSLMDMFGLPKLVGDNIKLTVQASGGGPFAVTGSFSYRSA